MKRNRMHGKPNNGRQNVGRRVTSCVLAGVLAASPLAGILQAEQGMAVYGLERQQVVTYEYYTRTLGHVVPASWLFVGTYLMDARALTPQLYQAALDSRAVYNQPIAYYTSELDNGEWKNVEGAGSLTTILPVAGKVSEETLYPYLVMVVVNEDGIPRDPVSGEPVDIYNLNDPYQMENIPEFQALLNYYQNGDMDDLENGAGEYYDRMLYSFFEDDNRIDYDRDSLDVQNAYNEYQTIMNSSGSRAQEELEQLWEDAWNQNQAAYPEEYRDLMLVMRNWPNIRDTITDQADADEAAVNELYQAVTKKGMEEEGDAALSVVRQVDAIRHAEIYYNLLENEQLLGSYGYNSMAETDDLMARHAEAVSVLANLAVETDRAEAAVLKLRDEEAALNTEKESHEKAIADETEEWDAFWKEELPDSNRTSEEAAAVRIEQLENELADKKELLVPIQENYEKLDAELNLVLDETVDLTNEQQALADEIDAYEQALAEQIANTDERVQELEQELQDLQARQNAANGRIAEYEAAVERSQVLTEKRDTLQAVMEQEQQKLSDLEQEAERYSTSRFTAFVNRDKTYDPDKKYALDSEVEAQKRVITSLDGMISSVVLELGEVDAVIREIEPDLDLAAEIKEAQRAVDEDIPDLRVRMIQLQTQTDQEIEDRQEMLANLSDPYQQQLRRLSDANDQYHVAEADYQAAKAEVDEVQKQIDTLQKKIEAYHTSIAAHEQAIENANHGIALKEAAIEVAQEPVDQLNAEADALQEEVDTLEGMLNQADTSIQSAYKKRAEVLALQLTSLEQHNTALESRKEAKEQEKDAELANAKNQYEHDSLVIEDMERQTVELDEEYSDLIENHQKNLEELDADMENRLRMLAKEQAAMDDEQLNTLKEQRTLTGRQLADGDSYYLITDKRRRVELEAASLNQRIAYYEEEKAYYEDKLNSRWGWLSYYSYQNRLEDCNEALNYYQTILADRNSVIENCNQELQSFLDRYESQYGVRPTDFDRQQMELQDQYAELNEAIDRRMAELKAEYEATEAGIRREWKDQKERYQTEYETNIQENREKYNDLNRQIQTMKAESLKAWQEAQTRKLQADNQIADYEAQITETGAQITQCQNKIAQIQEGVDEIVSFGPSPSLVMLQDAVEHGHTELGRNYAYMDLPGAGGTFEADEQLVTIIEQAMTDCKKAEESYRTKSMQRGTTAAEYTRYILSRKVAANAPDEETSLPYLQMLVDLTNIENTEIEHATRELSLLYGWLLPFSMRDFRELKTEEAVEDYQYYIRGAADRDTLENAIIFVTGRLEYARSLQSEFEEAGKSAALEAHILWLENLLRALHEREIGDSDESYSSEELDLLEEKEQAIEEGNLVRARQIDELLKGLINNGSASDSGGSDKNPNEDDLEPTDYPINERPKPEAEIKELILESIEYDDYEIEPDLDRYAATPGDLGELMEELKDIGALPDYITEVDRVKENSYDNSYAYGDGSLDPDDDKNNVGGENANNPGDGNTGTDGNGGNGTSDNSNGGTGSDGTGGPGTGGDTNTNPNGTDNHSNSDNNGTGTTQAEISRDDIESMVKDYFDDDFYDLADVDQAVVVASVALAASNTENDSLNQDAKALLEDLLNSGNSLIYRQYMEDRTTEYVSLGAVDKNRRLTRFRYVKNYGENQTTMGMIGGGSANYTFTVGDNSVLKNNGTTDKMDYAAVEQTDQYIRNTSDKLYTYLDEDDAKRFLGVSCIYIDGTDWAILIPAGQEQTVTELAKRIERMLKADN